MLILPCTSRPICRIDHNIAPVQPNYHHPLTQSDLVYVVPFTGGPAFPNDLVYIQRRYAPLLTSVNAVRLIVHRAIAEGIHTYTNYRPSICLVSRQEPYPKPSELHEEPVGQCLGPANARLAVPDLDRDHSRRHPAAVVGCSRTLKHPAYWPPAGLGRLVF